jgi:hypothetical protein
MVSASALAAELAVPPALVDDVMTAIGRAGYFVDEVQDSQLVRSIVVENTRAGGSWSDAVLAAYRARGARGPGDDGRTARVELDTEATLVQFRGRPVGRVIEHRQRCAFVRLDDDTLAAAVVADRLRARAGGLVIELTTDADGAVIVPGVPS